MVYRAEIIKWWPGGHQGSPSNVEKDIERDIALMEFLLKAAEKRSETKFLGLSRIFHDFSIGIRSELSFTLEALNGQRFRTIIEKYDEDNIFYIPKILKEFSRENILVMEYVDGIKFTTGKKLKK